MSEWTDGYRAALRDVENLALSRGLATPAIDMLIGDLVGDALVIEREQGNRLRRRRLIAEREALPLFDAVPP